MKSQNPIPLHQLARIIVARKPVLIDEIGTEALHFIDDNFRLEGFQGDTFQPWPKRVKADKGGKRKILVKTGTLRRSPIKTDGTNHTTISTDIPYAKTHNEGLELHHAPRSVILSFRAAKGGKKRFSKASKATEQQKAQIGAYSVKHKKRQFIGPSPVLDKRCEKVVVKILLTAVKNL